MAGRSPVVAALDIGKTNLKVVVATPDGRPLETLQTAHQFIQHEPYLSNDLGAMTDWFLDSLKELSYRHAIDALVPTAHGCGGVLVDAAGPRVTCAAESLIGSGGGTLGYGRDVTVGDFSCASSEAGMRCAQASTGLGFSVSRRAFTFF